MRPHYPSILGLAGLLVVTCVRPAFAQTIDITAVRVLPTENGVEIQLETSGATIPATPTRREENTTFAEISNARLNLPDSQSFRAVNPGPGIASVTVTQLENDRVRVEIVGREAGVEATIVPSPSGLTVNAVAEVPFEFIITATRTAVAEENVPRSVTTIDRDEIESQAPVSQNIGDVLGTQVPGLGPPTQSASTGNQSLRGRQPSILIDGVPLNSNRRSFQEFRNIDPAAIERIEVVRGATAVFGAEATGGVINIITRRPESEPFTATTTIGIGPYTNLSNFGETFSWRIEQNISGRVDNADYLLNLAYLDTGAFFDGEGERIPIGRAQGLDDLRSFNLLGKLGYDFDENQRLQFTFNYFDDKQDTSILTDASLDTLNARVKARAIDVGELEIDELPGRENILANLNYTHEDLFGSQLSAQFYYQQASANGGAVCAVFSRFNRGWGDRVFCRSGLNWRAIASPIMLLSARKIS